MANSELRACLSTAPSVLTQHPDWSCIKFVLFLLLEDSKGLALGCKAIGAASFWYPYLQIMPKVDLLGFWSQPELEQLQDRLLALRAEAYIQELRNVWKLLQIHILQPNPTLFDTRQSVPSLRESLELPKLASCAPTSTSALATLDGTCRTT